MLREVGGGIEVVVGQGSVLIERLWFLSVIGQPCRRLAHVELAGDYVGDEAGTVFAKEISLKRSSALGSFGLTSGWCSRARPRYAVLISSALASLATPAPCPNAECRCHVGYIHMPHLRGEALFGDGLLERIPQAGWQVKLDAARSDRYALHRGGGGSPQGFGGGQAR